MLDHCCKKAKSQNLHSLACGVTAGITLILAIMSGYALSRFKIRWNQWIVAAFLSAQMFPIVSRMISLYDLLGKASLINTRTGLILALTAAMLPFTTILMKRRVRQPQKQRLLR